MKLLRKNSWQNKNYDGIRIQQIIEPCCTNLLMSGWQEEEEEEENRKKTCN